MSSCSQCGMCVDPDKPYHPYAACLMFTGCRDGNKVQPNLDAVVEYGRQLGNAKLLAALRSLVDTVKAMRNPQTTADAALLVLKFKGPLEHADTLLAGYASDATA